MKKNMKMTQPTKDYYKDRYLNCYFNLLRKVMILRDQGENDKADFLLGVLNEVYFDKTDKEK